MLRKRKNNLSRTFFSCNIILMHIKYNIIKIFRQNADFLVMSQFEHYNTYVVKKNILGCRQEVRHGTLTPAFAGSNPAIPAKFLILLHKEIITMTSDKYHWEITSIKNRIAKLSSSKHDNSAIIRKQQRKLRKLEAQQ